MNGKKAKLLRKAAKDAADAEMQDREYYLIPGTGMLSYIMETEQGRVPMTVPQDYFGSLSEKEKETVAVIFPGQIILKEGCTREVYRKFKRSLRLKG